MKTLTYDLTKIPHIKLSYANQVLAEERIHVSTSQEVFSLLRDIWNEETIELKETAKVLLLNRANHVLGIYNLSEGGTAGTVMDQRLIFSSAILANASSIILAHNHPSGNIQPSITDIELTKRIKASGETLNVILLDHIIVTKSRHDYTSFADALLL